MSCRGRNYETRQQDSTTNSNTNNLFITAGAFAVGGLLGWFLTRKSNSNYESCRQNSRRASDGCLPPRRIEEDEPSQSPIRPKECPVCLKSLDFIRSKGGEVHVTRCGHIYCHYCIYQALSRNSECPICRQKMERDQTYPIFI